jgi:hypothetical protein
MALEIGIWRIDKGVSRVTSSRLDNEARLEDVIENDISILGLDILLVLGRQVVTAYGKRIDILAIDRDGLVYVVELKKDRTPREVVAQALDYGSWVGKLSADEIEGIYTSHASNGTGFAEAFRACFEAELPETINDGHRLVIVASELDPSTERIVEYLSEFEIPINVLFFRYFKDGEAEYIARTWLLDPDETESRGRRSKRTRRAWNGRDFYVGFGIGGTRSWDDAREYGFISGGGGPHYSRPLNRLEPGHRVFVHIPKSGYVGVATVTESAQPVKDFTVEVDSKQTPLLDLPLKANMAYDVDDSEKCEYVVRVRWLKALDPSEAYWETGLFANQTTACRLTNQFTLDKLYQRFDIRQDDNDSAVGNGMSVAFSEPA